MSWRPRRRMLITVMDGRGRVREAVCGELRCPACRAAAGPSSVAGYRVGDFGQDIGVVGEAEPFGDPHGLVGGVGGQDAGDLGEFGVRDGPHLLIDCRQFAVAGDLADGLGGSGGQQAGDERRGAAHGQQRAFGIVQPPFPRGEVRVYDDRGQRQRAVAQDGPQGCRAPGLEDLRRVLAGQDRGLEPAAERAEDVVGADAGFAARRVIIERDDDACLAGAGRPGERGGLPW